jgi:hypothetical protein
MHIEDWRAISSNQVLCWSNNGSLTVVMDCSGQPKPDQANVFAQAQHHLAIQVICDLLSCSQCIVLLTKWILEVSAGWMCLFLRHSCSIKGYWVNRNECGTQKLVLQASGANAVALGGFGMMSGIPPGLMASMTPGMGNDLSNPLETPTKVIALTQVSLQEIVQGVLHRTYVTCFPSWGIHVFPGPNEIDLGG